MTVNISHLLRTLDATANDANAEDATEWRALHSALATYEDLPLAVLTTKLGQIVLKKPAAKAPRSTAGGGGAKPKVTTAQRQEALAMHAAALSEHFHNDAAFTQAFEKAKADTALDAKTALALFAKVIGEPNFPTTPLRRPTVFKQLREQRQTMAYRQGRNEEQES